MLKLFGNRKTGNKLTTRDRIIYAALITVGLFLVTAASVDLIWGRREYAIAETEYSNLIEQYPVMSAYMADVRRALALDDDFVAPDAGIPLPGSVDGNQRDLTGGADPEDIPDPLAGLTELNPDFIAWLSIEDVLEYPVVRGRNNDYYLNRTFTGERNSSGAVFMDYRCREGFDEPICIIYGHNMRNGSMFASLHGYRDTQFMADHPYIIIVTSTGDVLVYRVFATGINEADDILSRLRQTRDLSTDPVFRRAPEGSDRFLILSTCTRSTNDNERLRIYAALVGAV